MIRRIFLLTLLSALCTSLQAQTVIRVACVGDSITAGAGVKEPKNKYPARLGVLLGAEYEVKNFGVSGATMLDTGDKPYKTQKAFQDAIDFKPDIVVIKLGTNDSKPQNWAKSDDFDKSTESLVEAFQKANPKVKVYLCHPAPVIGKGNFGIRKEIVKPEIIPLIDQVAKKMKLEVIDLYTALEAKPELIPDRVHPNDEGAGVIATTVHAAISKK
jgi:lysophospholipase L1-like esterase